MPTIGRIVSAGMFTLAAGLPITLLTGCNAHPFAHAEGDLGRRVAGEDTVREVAPFDQHDYLTAQPRTLEEAAGDPLELELPEAEHVALTLAEVRAAALTNNLDLAVALVDPNIAATRVTEEEAAFEALFSAQFNWNEIDDATSSSLSSAEARIQTLVPSVTVPTRTGGEVSVSLPMSRRRDSNSFTTLNPSYTSDLEFSISHQLLRGAGRRANTHALRIASYDERIGLAQTKLETIRQLANADRAYWRLFRARAELDVAQTQLELAQAQLERSERQSRVGRVPEIEVVRSQAGVARRLEGILLAENDVRTTERELKRLINVPGMGVDTSTRVDTVSDPEPVELLFDADALSRAALARRPEMLELELRLAQDASTIEFNENQALPLLSVDYAYRLNGLGESLGDSYETMAENEFESWDLSVRGEIPIGNEAAKSRVRRAILTRLQRLRTREARRVAITQEVFDAVDQIRTTWQRILAARQNVVLSTRAFEAEERQFGVGRSTSTDVLEAAAELADAQVAEIRAVTDYQIAKIDLAFATGTLLGSAGVRFEEPTFERSDFERTIAEPPSDKPDSYEPEWLDRPAELIEVGPSDERAEASAEESDAAN